MPAITNFTRGLVVLGRTLELEVVMERSLADMHQSNDPIMLTHALGTTPCVPYRAERLVHAIGMYPSVPMSSTIGTAQERSLVCSPVPSTACLVWELDFIHLQAPSSSTVIHHCLFHNIDHHLRSVYDMMGKYIIYRSIRRLLPCIVSLKETTRPVLRWLQLLLF